MKYRDLTLLLIGILVALFVFGFNTPLLPKFQVQYTINSSQSDWITAVSTLAAVFIALLIAVYGERLKEYGAVRPAIELIDSLENIQENRDGVKQGWTRLVFKNTGGSTAEEVEVYVSQIFDFNKPRENFIAVPLSWTHDGRSRRNFHSHQYGYLDFCLYANAGKKGGFPHLVLTAGAGIPTYEEIYQFTNKVELTVFQKNGLIKKYLVKIDLASSNPFVRVKKVTQLVQSI